MSNVLSNIKEDIKMLYHFIDEILMFHIICCWPNTVILQKKKTWPCFTLSCCQQL